MGVPVNRKPLKDRLLARVDFLNPNGCWIWTGCSVVSRSGKRYGRIREAGKGSRMVLVHRASFEIHKGPLLGECDHQCRETLCFNPDHLRDASHVENGWSHKRDAATGQYAREEDDQWMNG